MSMDGLIARLCKQTAVYWGTPVEDGYGGCTFADPVEIACRWEDKKEVYMSGSGEQLVSLAVVYVTQDVDEKGWLYLGLLTDFDSSLDTSKPKALSGTFEIKRFDKSPSLLVSTDCIRKVYL